MGVFDKLKSHLHIMPAQRVRKSREKLLILKGNSRTFTDVIAVAFRPHFVFWLSLLHKSSSIAWSPDER